VVFIANNLEINEHVQNNTSARSKALQRAGMTSSVQHGFNPLELMLVSLHTKRYLTPTSFSGGPSSVLPPPGRGNVGI